MDRKNLNKMYCLAYRIRKSDTSARIDVRQRTVFVGYDMPQSAKICRLRSEFNFVIQLEIR
jgi:hypothetical protein